MQLWRSSLQTCKCVEWGSKIQPHRWLQECHQTTAGTLLSQWVHTVSWRLGNCKFQWSIIKKMWPEEFPRYLCRNVDERHCQIQMVPFSVAVQVAKLSVLTNWLISQSWLLYSCFTAHNRVSTSGYSLHEQEQCVLLASLRISKPTG